MRNTTAGAASPLPGEEAIWRARSQLSRSRSCDQITIGKRRLPRCPLTCDNSAGEGRPRGRGPLHHAEERAARCCLRPEGSNRSFGSWGIQNIGKLRPVVSGMNLSFVKFALAFPVADPLRREHGVGAHDPAAAERRLRSEVNIELNFPPKLRGARSQLYRRRFLQVNTRWKALAEIYTMHSFAPFSNLNFFVKNRQNFFAIELMNIH